MEMIRMNSPKQVRLIYQVLKEGIGTEYKDSEILIYAGILQELFNEEFEQGYDYKPFYDELNIKDSFSLMSSEYGDLMYQEKDLLNSVYEFESDEFITNKPWNKKYFGVSYDC